MSAPGLRCTNPARKHGSSRFRQDVPVAVRLRPFSHGTPKPADGGGSAAAGDSTAPNAVASRLALVTAPCPACARAPPRKPFDASAGRARRRSGISAGFGTPAAAMSLRVQRHPLPREAGREKQAGRAGSSGGPACAPRTRRATR
jgi:hypothetical protein